MLTLKNGHDLPGSPGAHLGWFVAALMFATPIHAQQSPIVSPDKQYSASRTGSDTGTRYQVTAVKTKKVVLTTHAEFPTSNDVKAGAFSPDSQRFAAAYHYGHDGQYTWIGIWSVETGKLVGNRKVPKHTLDVAQVFSK